jgi:hypothetical protein
MATSIPKITQQSLLPGDVLLSCGSEWISDAIRLLSGGSYSHAGLWDGRYSIDATKHGVKRNPLADVVSEQRYVDAFRWHPVPLDGHLGDTAYPYAPVLNEAAAIVALGPKFAYDELLMAGLVIAISGMPSSLALRVAARIILSQLQRLVHILIPPGKRGMMCTEVVCTSFWKALPKGHYAINILLGASRAADLLKKIAGPSLGPAGWATRSLDDTSAATYRDVQAECARLVLEAGGPALQRSLDAASRAPVPSFAGGPVPLPAGGPLVPLGCVTPLDLEGSPNLEIIGRLTVPAGRTSLRPAARRRAPTNPRRQTSRQ